MTTFTTTNQSRQKYTTFGIGILVLIVIVCIVFTIRSNDSAGNFPVNLNYTRNNASLVAEEDKSLIVSTSSGTLRGKKVFANGKRVNVFLSVPYAKADPFSGPKQSSWEGVRDAHVQPPACIQPDLLPELSAFRLLNLNISESCLFLNIFIPSNTSKLWPILVYIPGGAFNYGGIGSEELDPSVFVAKNDVVVVTVQYRIGAYGFLKFKDADNEYFGLSDQKAALNWIASNIGQFGGDESHITLAVHGSSALTTMLMAKDLLFERIIVQGGAFLADLNNVQKRFIRASEELMKRLDCDESEGLKCIKEKPFETVLEAQSDMFEENGLLIGPVANFSDFYLDSGRYLNGGRFNIIIGMGSEDDKVLGVTENDDCGLINLYDKMSNYSSIRAYKLNNDIGSTHDEVVFAFGLPFKNSADYEKDEKNFSDMLGKHWAQFARNGDLIESLSLWPQYTVEDRQYLLLSAGLKETMKFDVDKCNMNEIVGYHNDNDDANVGKSDESVETDYDENGKDLVATPVNQFNDQNKFNDKNINVNVNETNISEGYVNETNMNGDISSTIKSTIEDSDTDTDKDLGIGNDDGYMNDDTFTEKIQDKEKVTIINESVEKPTVTEKSENTDKDMVNTEEITTKTSEDMVNTDAVTVEPDNKDREMVLGKSAEEINMHDDVSNNSETTDKDDATVDDGDSDVRTVISEATVTEKSQNTDNEKTEENEKNTDKVTEETITEKAENTGKDDAAVTLEPDNRDLDVVLEKTTEEINMHDGVTINSQTTHKDNATVKDGDSHSDMRIEMSHATVTEKSEDTNTEKTEEKEKNTDTDKVTEETITEKAEDDAVTEKTDSVVEETTMKISEDSGKDDAVTEKTDSVVEETTMKLSEDSGKDDAVTEKTDSVAEETTMKLSEDSSKDDAVTETTDSVTEETTMKLSEDSSKDDAVTETTDSVTEETTMKLSEDSSKDDAVTETTDSVTEETTMKISENSGKDDAVTEIVDSVTEETIIEKSENSNKDVTELTMEKSENTFEDAAATEITDSVIDSVTQETIAEKAEDINKNEDKDTKDDLDAKAKNVDYIGFKRFQLS